jgi:hypothetical protein
MKRAKQHKSTEPGPLLQGWKTIAQFLGQPVVTAQRWAKSGMPVTRQGRYTVANREELSRWLGRESHMPAPAHIYSLETDLSADLKQSLSAVRHHRRRKAA